MITLQELIDAVDRAGSWAEFMQRGGLGEDDVPMDIRAKWVEVIWAWSDFQSAVDRLEADLPLPRD